MDTQSIDFMRDKYIFSKERHIRKVRKNISKERIRLFINELKKYKISLLKLSRKEISQRDRNLLLNIALYIYEDDRMLKLIRKNKTLPFNKLSKQTNINMDFLIKWRGYILAYVILASDNKYVDIYDYLDVNFKELENNNTRRTYVDIDIYRGVVLEVYKNSAVILTSSGEFININKRNEIIGADICGRRKLGLKPYKKLIICISLLCFIVGALGFYSYGRERSTIVIQGTSRIKFTVNSFNRITYGYSATEKGKLLFNEAKWKNKSVTSALDDIFSFMIELDMIPNNRKIEIIVTGESLKESNIDNISEYVSCINSDGDLSNDIRVIINNSGNEKILK